MTGRILQRVLLFLPMLLIVSLLVFVIAHLAPGDPVENMLARDATPDQIAAIRASYGLDQPWYVQYAVWIGHVLTGDFGTSIVLKIPVVDVLGPALLNTTILTASAVIFSLVVGVTVGFVSGVRHGRLADRIFMTATQVGNNMPLVWLSLFVIWLFAVQLRWLPTSGMYDLREGPSFVSLLEHLVLPTICASAVSLLVLARLTRSAVIGVESSDYLRTYRSLGFSRLSLVRWPILRNTAPPIITITGLQIGYLLGGVVLVESIFSWPGVGNQLYAAVTGNDYPMIQAGVLVISVSFLTINLVTDVIVDLLNPRLRRGPRLSSPSAPLTMSAAEVAA